MRGNCTNLLRITGLRVHSLLQRELKTSHSSTASGKGHFPGHDSRHYRKHRSSNRASVNIIYIIMKALTSAKESRDSKPNTSCLQGPCETCYDLQLNATARIEAVKAVSRSMLARGHPMASKLAAEYRLLRPCWHAREGHGPRGRRRTTQETQGRRYPQAHESTLFGRSATWCSGSGVGM